MIKQSEMQLAENIVKWLQDQHWEVYQEVMFSGSSVADIVAVRSKHVWIIECKTSLTFTVLEQAHRWQCHFRSVAVPKSMDRNKRRFAYDIATDYLKVGIIEVKGTQVAEIEPPPLMREYHKRSKWMLTKLLEEHKTYLKAGSKRGGYYTPYRRTMDSVKEYIGFHSGCTLKEIMNELKGNHHYASNASARTCIQNALSEWETWCRIESVNNEFRYFVK